MNQRHVLPELSMKDKIVLIFGGSKGIGAGCAEVFVEVGATAIITARSREAGVATAGRLSARGPGTCKFMQCDSGELEAVRELVDEVASTYGRLDCVVNNAVLYPGWKPIDDVTAEEFLTVLRVNMLGYFAACQHSLPHLRASSGTIVNISSLAGELGGWHDTTYSASKGAITAFTKSLATEEASNGVRVNAILPGNIWSDARVRGEKEVLRRQAFHDYIESWQWLGRSGTVREVGLAALFLGSAMSSFCTGITLVVSGGLEIGYGVKQPYPDFNSTADDLS